MTTSPPCQGSTRPAERAEANSRSCSTGKSRSASTLRMTPPTWPVAPTIPILMRFVSDLVQRGAPAVRGAALALVLLQGVPELSIPRGPGLPRAGFAGRDGGGAAEGRQRDAAEGRRGRV